ncbi:hypothetical protein D3C76_1782500 [compost metagenome]
MSDMNHVNDSALDVSRQHREKSQIPALEKAQRQNHCAVHEEKNVPHGNITFSGYDRAEDIEAAGRPAHPQ